MNFRHPRSPGLVSTSGSNGSISRSGRLRLRLGVVSLLGIALLVAACGSPTSSNGVATLESQGASGGPDASVAPSASDDFAQQLLAYSQCVRDHGVPNFPDLGTSNGSVVRPNLASLGIDPNSATFRAAAGACQSLLPTPQPEAQQQMSAQDQAKWLQFSACVRAHGVPNFPDPDFSNGGLKPFFNYNGTGVDSQSPTVAAAMDACKPVLPNYGSTASGADSGSSASPSTTAQP
jgi:hypothetical protein